MLDVEWVSSVDFECLVHTFEFYKKEPSSATMLLNPPVVDCKIWQRCLVDTHFHTATIKYSNTLLYLVGVDCQVEWLH